MKLLCLTILFIFLFGFSCLAEVPNVNLESDGYCGDDYKKSGFFAFAIDAFFAFDENNLVISCGGALAKPDAPKRILTSRNSGKTWTKRLELEHSSINKFAFPDNKTGFAVGAHYLNNKAKGFILKTTDNGLSWKKISIEISGSLEDIQFIDKLNGWIASDEGNFLKTSDGGNTWTIINQKPFTKKELFSVNLSFSDKNSGWMITVEREFINNGEDAIIDGDIYQTQDGGKTWISRKDKFLALLKKWSPQEISFQAIKFFDVKTGFIAAHFMKTERNPNDGENHIIFEGGVVFSTKNGGETWETQIITTDFGLKSADFSTDGRFWAIPARVWQTDYVFSSSDYGKSWKQISTEFTDGDTPTRIYFLNDKIGFLIANIGMDGDNLYRTLDGGKTWELR